MIHSNKCRRDQITGMLLYCSMSISMMVIITKEKRKKNGEKKIKETVNGQYLSSYYFLVSLFIFMSTLIPLHLVSIFVSVSYIWHFHDILHAMVPYVASIFYVTSCTERKTLNILYIPVLYQTLVCIINDANGAVLHVA